MHVYKTVNGCSFDITQKDAFCLAFYFKLKFVVLFDLFYQQPFVFFLYLCFHYENTSIQTY